jgi:hypothetical protein
MIYVKHRVNNQSELVDLNKNIGAEIDIRIYNGKIVLAHDPFTEGEEFEKWILKYKHELLIINTKEDGLEFSIIQTLKKYKIENYFFLDQPFPTQRRCLLENIPIAIRISDLEPINILNKITPEWIWLDNFSDNWEMIFSNIKSIKHSFPRICLVSPELQNRKLENEILQIHNLVKNYSIKIDAVCTKFPEIWKKTFEL